MRKIVADESVDAQIIHRLREDGFNVLSIAEVSPSVSDDVVLKLAYHESALLLTADKDFGALVFRQRQVAMGIVLTRLAELLPTSTPDVVSQAFKDHGSEFDHNFTVITPGDVRIRAIL
jgi:predicted nuclease of predicted toxin-antitoxin system